MEPSILTSTKKALGLASDYDAFDLEITTFINSALSSLAQLGVGPTNGLVIDDDAVAVWEDLGLNDILLSMVKPYVYLKSRMLFDPPATSFVMEAMEKQIQEAEWRITTFRDTVDPFYTEPVVEEV